MIGKSMWDIVQNLRRKDTGFIEAETVCTNNGYLIQVTNRLSKDIISDVNELLYSFEPITAQFKLGGSHISFVNHIDDTPHMKVRGFTSGYNDHNSHQHVKVIDTHPHVLIHELGHVVDRYGDNKKNLLLSRHSEFSPVVVKYREAIIERTTNDNLNHETDEVEIFAYLFEQYCKDALPHISLTQQTSANLQGVVAKELYQNNPEIKQFFDDKLKFLNKRIISEKFETLLSEDLNLLEKESLSL